MCKIKGVCKDCDWFNWKVSTDRSFGECLNPKNEKATWISLVKVDPDKLGNDFHGARQEIKDYAVIMMDEEIMGCVNFEPRNKENFIHSVKNFFSNLWKKK